MEYIYKYEHPKKGVVYIGRTNNLQNRIESHDTSKYDNISRKNEKILLESKVMFFELGSYEESVYVEKFLIDKYKPIFNVRDKNNCSVCSVDMIIPEFKEYVRNPLETKTSKAQLRAVAKYQRERAEIRLRVSHDIKQLADAQAKSKRLSLTAYITMLIENDNN